MAGRRVYREDTEQRALIQWADMTPMPASVGGQVGEKIGDYLFAIPNGGARNRIEAARLYGLGVRAGVADLFFSFPSPGLPRRHGLYIEMKARKPYAAKITDNQNAFLHRMSYAGYESIVCYGWDAAERAIKLYLRCEL